MLMAADPVIAACWQEAEGVAHGDSVVRGLGGFPLETTTRRTRGNSAVWARATKAAAGQVPLPRFGCSGHMTAQDPHQPTGDFPSRKPFILTTTGRPKAKRRRPASRASRLSIETYRLA